MNKEEVAIYQIKAVYISSIQRTKIGVPGFCPELKFVKTSAAIFRCIKILGADLWLTGLEICCFLEDLHPLPKLNPFGILVKLSIDQSSEKQQLKYKIRSIGCFLGMQQNKKCTQLLQHFPFGKPGCIILNRGGTVLAVWFRSCVFCFVSYNCYVFLLKDSVFFFQDVCRAEKASGQKLVQYPALWY